MNQIAFIHTPASFKNTKDTSSLTSLAKLLFPSELFIISEPTVDLNIVLQNFKRRNVGHIIVSSGDGTLSRVMTAIHHVYPQNSFPKLTILPSGNTNLIAYDLGATRRDSKYLQDIISKRIKLRSVFRHTLQISFPNTDRLAQLGMFGGAGFYENAIHYSRNEVEKIAQHRIAILATILKTSLKILFSKKDRNIGYQGTRMPWKNVPFSHFSQNIFFTLMTSLEKLPYGLWPFWNGSKVNKSGFTFLRVSSFPNSFPKAIIHLLSGKIPSWMKNSEKYQSGKALEIQAELRASFILDGEFISPSKDGEIKISLGPKIEFLI